MASVEESTAAVSQASGMVSVQAECPVDQALALMRDRAIVNGETLEEIATAVVARGDQVRDGRALKLSPGAPYWNANGGRVATRPALLEAVDEVRRRRSWRAPQSRLSAVAECRRLSRTRASADQRRTSPTRLRNSTTRPHRIRRPWNLPNERGCLWACPGITSVHTIRQTMGFERPEMKQRSPVSVMVVINFHASEGNSGGVLALLQEGRDVSRVAEGCEAFDLYQRKDDPARFMFVERWSSLDADHASMAKNIVDTGHLAKLLPLLDAPIDSGVIEAV